MYTRNLSLILSEALQDTPVLLLNGGRQVGKSTLVQSLLKETHQYYTLDDTSVLSSIKKDPAMFLQGLISPTIIDEVQRGPELFLPLKKIVDENRRSGFFVLTGSADILSLPKIADSLAGRMEIHSLWPLSQGEIHNQKEDCIHTLFSDNLYYKKNLLTQADLIHTLLQGGYPEALSRKSAQRKRSWFSSYLTTILEKDIRDLSHIEGLLELPKLMQLFATRCANLLNVSEVARSAGISVTTLKRYIALLEKTFLLVNLPAWSRNLSKRLVKAPKVYINDTGLLSYLVDYDENRLKNDQPFLGHVLENFVVMELKKQLTWSQQRCAIYHYRNHSHQEIDIILEAPDGRVVAIEVKLSSTVGAKDFAAMESLERDLGQDFRRGIVFYMGDSLVPYGVNKHAVPLPFLWQSAN